MDKLEQIKEQYANERVELRRQRERKEITFSQHSYFLRQLNNAENMDLMDAMLEGEC